MPSEPQSVPSPDAGAARHYILGTAGHIDHGKTSLVRALTGTDTDRLPEERRRGMTIELGFADLEIGSTRFGIVDVPGHERFVRTMVAGATGVDVALIVVAADDSVMPQTIEHVEILDLLGVTRGVVAITKIDTVESDLVELVTDDVQTLLADTPLEVAPICPVSSITGEGLDELRSAISAATEGIEAVTSASPFRMAADRVFTVQGRGTVVTGSVLRGAVSEGDTLEVWPGGHTCRVRGLQTHGAHSAALARGQRAAINISGIDRQQLQRGSELATPGYLEPSHMLDVHLRCLSSYGRALKSTATVRLELGATDVPVRVVLLEGGSLAPGETGYAQLRGGVPVTAVHGQRFIIRDENATRTIGGGVVLRPTAKRRRRPPDDERQSLERLALGEADDRLEEVLRTARFVQPVDLQLCAQSSIELDGLSEVLDRLQSAGRRVSVAGTEIRVVPAAIDDLSQRLAGWLERHHRRNPELPGRPVDTVLGYLERTAGRNLARPLLDSFLKAGTLKRLGRFICLPSFAPSLSGADEKLMAAMIDEIRSARFQPPALDGLNISAKADRKRWNRLATLAVAMGELIQIDPKLYLHAESEQTLRTRVSELIREHGGVTVAQVREALDSSRKFVVPFLEYLDRVGYTTRTCDQRVLAAPSGNSRADT